MRTTKGKDLMRAILAGTLAAFLVTASVSARADDPAGAQALFTEAKKLMSAGKYADACPKLEESDRVAPAIGTKFNLADCYEHTGKTASAWAAFLSVAAAAKNANQPPREKAARDRAKALEPKLSRIAIRVPDASNVTGLEIKRDDGVIGSAEWGEAMPVDPGEHTVTATAPGKRAWKAIVEVEGAGGSAKVIVPPLDDEPVAPAAAPAAPAAAAATTDAAPAGASDRGSSSTKTVGFVLVGVGAAVVVGGAVVWALRTSEVSKLSADCVHGCPASDASDISNGKMYDALGITLFAVGGAALVTGGGLVLFGGHPRAQASARIVPVFAARGGGLGLAGSF